MNRGPHKRRGPGSAVTDHDARSGFSTSKSERLKPTTEKGKSTIVLTMAPGARWAVRYRGSNVVLETFASKAGAQARIKQLNAQGALTPATAPTTPPPRLTLSALREAGKRRREGSA